MASNLGSMVLELSANVARFQSDMGKAAYIAQQNAEKMVGYAKNIVGAFGLALSTDKLIEFGKRAIDTADEVGKMAQKVGISVEALSALQMQAKLSNIANDQLQQGLSKLAKSAADAAGGGKQSAAVYAALGVSVKDAAGNLKPMEVLLGEVAAKFATYRDSAAKTALAQQVFGKSGAELIPYLNELGQKSLPEVIKQAEEFGAVISTKTAKQAEEFNDNITRLKSEAEGFANAVVSQVLPSLVDLSKQMVDAGKTTDGYASSASGTATAVKGFILALITAKEIVAAFATGVFAVFDAISTVFNASGQIVAAWVETTAKALKAAFNPFKEGAADAMASADAEFTARVKAIGANVATALKGATAGLSGGVEQATDNAKKAYDALFGSTKKAGDAAEDAGKKFGQANAPIVANAAATDEAAKNAARLAEMFAKDGEQLASIRARIDPVNAIYQQYVKTIASAVAQYETEVALAATSKTKDDDLAAALANLNAKRAAGLQVQQESIANLVKENDIVAKYFRTIEDQQALIGLDDRTKTITESLIHLTEEWKNGNKAVHDYLISIGAIDPTSEQGRKKIEEVTGALYDQQKAADLAAESARGWQSIWAQAGSSVADTFAKILVEGGSLFKSLRDLAKQTVEQIIAYFAKLAVINPILNAVFGRSIGFSELPTIAGSPLGVGLGLMTSGGLSTSGSIAGGGSYNLLNADGSTSGLLGGISGKLGSLVSIAGGIFAGIGAFRGAGGGVPGIASGLASGYGTYAIGTAVTAGISAGSLTAGLAAIPVVGWVAIGAMVLNKLTGGGLFGTSWKPTGVSNTSITIDDSGATVSNSYQESKKKALFGGTKYKNVNVPASADQISSATDLLNSIKAGAEAFAAEFGQSIDKIIGGTYKIATDKAGKQTFTSTIGGQTFSGETQQQFAERLQSANFLAVLDKMGLGASQFVAGLTNDADALAAAVQDFAQATQDANIDLANGFKFLALNSNATLIDVMKFVEGAQKAGETLTQTYTRLAQAQTQYDQFVGQFKPTTSYVDDFEAGMSQVYHSMLANIDAANKLAIAAGASGAAQEDLTNIQNVAAQQMAALTVQLENSAQSLAFSLGLTTQGTLDQVNSAINDVISSVKGIADPVTDTSRSLSNFSSAITSVAQRAADATNLLLGALSPLNDQQKLQIALQGLRAGTVTKEQVLQIGRSLYASSEAYTKLFNSVLHFPSAGGGGFSGSSFSSSASSKTVVPNAPPKDWTDSMAQWASTGLTSAQWNALSDKDKKKLENLLNQQATLAAAKNTQDFQTLAQQIAEIASAKGESFQQALQDMGIKQEDIEKGLGLKSDADLQAYADALQKQIDSAGDNTKSIVDAINMLPQGIANAVQGKPIGNAVAAPPPAGNGGGGSRTSFTVNASSSRTISDEDAEAIGKSVGRYVGKEVSPVIGRSVRYAS